MKPPRILESWLDEIIAYLIYNGWTPARFAEAAAACDHPVDPKDADNIIRCKAFLQAWDAAVRQGRLEAANPQLVDREAMIGMHLQYADRLCQQSKFKEASEVVEKASKLRGYISDAPQVHVPSNAEITRAKEELKARREAESKPN